MRLSSVMLPACVASCDLASCETPAPKTQTLSSSSAPAAAASVLSSSSDPLDLLTTQIDTTITLGAWLKSHPDDEISVVPAVSGIEDPFCRGAVAKTRLMGRTVVRSALFYIPAAPKGEKLTTDTTKIAEDYCELRTVVLASEGMDSLAVRALGDSLALLIEKRLGPHRDSIPSGAGGIPGMQDGKIWSGPGTRVIVATPPVDKAHSSTFAVAYAPGSGVQGGEAWVSRYRDEAAQRATDQQTLYRDVDSALTWAGLPSVTADLQTVIVFLRSHEQDDFRDKSSPQVEAALLRALKTIHATAPSLSPQRRAAALLAGDVTLFAMRETHDSELNSRMSQDLDSVGISFAPLPGKNGYRNTRAWLWQAYELDSTGRAGRAAFDELLGLQWPVAHTCNGHEYARVIEHGEAALANGYNDPLIHFYVGSAYKAIYDLANAYRPEASIKAQAESARLKAIEHFRAVLESSADPGLRRYVWTKAMRLILHRPEEHDDRYACFPD